jgi:midasin
MPSLIDNDALFDTSDVINNVEGCSEIVLALVERGESSREIWDILNRIMDLQVLSETPATSRSISDGISSMATLRDSLACPSLACLHNEARVLRSLTTWTGELADLSFLGSFRFDLFHCKEEPNELDALYDLVCPSMCEKYDWLTFRDHLILLFLVRQNNVSMHQKATFLGRLKASFGGAALALAKQVCEYEVSGRHRASLDSTERVSSKDSQNTLEWFTWQVALQERNEARDLEHIMNGFDGDFRSHTLSLLGMSYLVAKALIDRSAVVCSVTPLMFPLLKVIQDYLTMLPIHFKSSKLKALMDLHAKRIELWNLCRDTCICHGQPSVFLFDETEFIVMWTSFRFYFDKVRLSEQEEDGLSVQVGKKLDALVNRIDSVVYYDKKPAQAFLYESDVTCKPVIPRSAEPWSFIMSIKGLSQSISIDRQHSRTPLYLDELVSSKHPCLYVTKQMKHNLMMSLSMLFIASAGEVPSLGPSEFGEAAMQALSKEFEAANSLFNRMLEVIDISPSGSDEGILGMGSGRTIDGMEAGDVEAWLLERFASLQLAPLAEFYCEAIERMYVRAIAGLLLCQQEVDWTEMSKLVAFALSNTVLNVHLHQMLLWASETENKEMIACLMLSLSCESLHRAWSGSARLFDRMTWSLSLPSSFVSIEKNANASIQGVRQRRESIPDATVYSLLSHEFHSTCPSKKSGKFMTIENHRTRKKQSRELLDFLCRLDIIVERDEPWEINLQLREVVIALGDVLPEEERQDITVALSSQHGLSALDIEKIERRITGIRKKTAASEYLKTLILPLLKCLERFWSGKTSSNYHARDYAKARVYLGLLRFRLLVPDSPLDPGQKPLAKVRINDRRMETIRLELSAHRIDGLFVESNQSPINFVAQKLLNEGQLLLLERESQAERIIHRPKECPTFVSLYREITDFASQFLLVEKVLSLLNETELECEGDIIHKLDHFQATAEAFSSRLRSQFAVYEDVIVPLLDALGSIMFGLSDLKPALEGVIQSRVTADGEQLLRQCGQFPMTGMLNVLPVLDTKSRRSLGIAQLALFGVQRKARVQSPMSRWYAMVEGVFETDPTYNRSQVQLKHLDDEQEYREQFPDHLKDFKTSGDEYAMELAADEAKIETSALHDSHVTLMCELHEKAFSQEVLIDSDRIEAFKLFFETSCRLYDNYGAAISATMASPLSGYALALSLFNVEENQSGSSSLQSTTDFFRKAQPEETTQADKVLASLNARLTVLHAAFPDNSILLAVSKVTEQIRKFDIFSVPLAKTMVGLELILKHAQDWEQHASVRVKIGEPLADVQRLVSRWRRIQLQSWSMLLEGREEVHNRRAKLHWAHLFSILRPSDTESESGNNQHASSDELLLLESSWVFEKPKRDKNTSASRLADIVKVLDTFILTASLGQFIQRARMLDCFAFQMKTEVCQHFLYEDRHKLSRCVMSISTYYNQFIPKVKDELSRLRSPVEKKLKDEVKLAKWDEKNYYAASESSERNYRKLMLIIKEYDEILNVSAMDILEREICKGIRDPASANQEPSTSVPATSSMFPLIDPNAKRTAAAAAADNHISNCIETISVSPREVALPSEWENTQKLGVDEGSHAAKIGRYAKKMALFRQQMYGKSVDLYSRLEVSDLCSAIFDRIESLRSKKAGRPMKERALVDLLKELHHQGYTSTKWSTPSQIRRFHDIFELPLLSEVSEGHNACFHPVIHGGESYFQRCLAEIDRLRAETSFGSQYLTQRQMTMMMSLSESGLLMLLQERCLLFSLFSSRQSLVQMIDNVRLHGEVIPPGQNMLRGFVSAFDDCSDSLLENLQEHRLLLSCTQRMYDQENKVALLNELSRFIDAAIVERRKHIPWKKSIVTQDCLQSILVEHEALTAFHQALQLHIARRRGLLPVDAIHSTLVLVQKTIDSASACLNLDWSLFSTQACSDTHRFAESLSTAVESALLSVQSIRNNQENKSFDDEKSDTGSSIWGHHHSFMKRATEIYTAALPVKISRLLSELSELHDNPHVSERERAACTNLSGDLGVLLQLTADMIDNFLAEMTAFYREAAKLQYVLLRVFRVLTSKGFCADKTEDKGNEGDDVSGMNFGEDDGTGMGAGEGKIDVTDQIEDEEQLLGLKGEEEESQPQEKSKELDKEEAEKGMEMTEQFEGEMYDVPEENDCDQSKNEDDGEELDREMGDESGPNEQVVDEEMWNEDDDDESNEDSGPEKFEKDSKVRGGATGDEMMTNDEEKDENDNASNEEKETAHADESKEAERKEEEGNGDDEAINDDMDDQYEDSHGVQVRQDQDDGEDQNELAMDEDMDLDEQISESGGDGSDDDDAIDQEDDSSPQNDVDNPKDAVEDKTPEDEENLDDGPDMTSTAIPSQAEPEDKDSNEDNKDDKNEEDEPEHRVENEKAKSIQGLGVQAQDGEDGVDHAMEEDADPASGDGDDTNEKDASGNPDTNQNQEGGGSGTGSKSDNLCHGPDTQKSQSKAEDTPNPLKKPGDASRYWHRKLNIFDMQTDAEDTIDKDNADTENIDEKGDFEHTKSDVGIQALAKADETEADNQVEPVTQDNDPGPPKQADEADGMSDEKQSSPTRRSNRPNSQPTQPDETEPFEDESMGEDEQQETHEATNMESDESVATDAEEEESFVSTGNRVVSDLSQLQIDASETPTQKLKIESDEKATRMSQLDETAARDHWNALQSETYALSRRLCEKLRLVMEPLVASKLRGDYRTGKRINMKRVIGYIASGFRKDKIWLRRTKPAKRNYRVLIAVDDSESMRKSGAGEMAMKALATLAVGMSHLEIGEIGVASFGDEMNLVHSFEQPFTSESGPNIVGSFRFDQQRTRTALCVESTMLALEATGVQASMQLVFMISDGRIERDSRAVLRRLIRELTERNILLAMIIVEGKKQKDSILNMKEVTFEKNKPIIKSFMEDYPFPYYIVVDDMQSLPEVLGDALRQWFEMIGRLQGN